MIIGLSADSKQYLYDVVSEYLKQNGYEVKTYGALAGENAADYVSAAGDLAEAIAIGECDEGVLLCNTGTGVSIVANKVAGVRAAVCVDEFSAEIAKIANNANILVLSMRLTGDMLARQILDRWFATDPAKADERRRGLHQRTDEFDRKHRRA